MANSLTIIQFKIKILQNFFTLRYNINNIIFSDYDIKSQYKLK